MEEVILYARYPKGTLPGRGFRCKICGDEVYRGDDVAKMQDLAEKLGLYGLMNGRTRKLIRTGGSLAVTLDPSHLKKILGRPAAGRTVRVGLQGKRIVIEASDED